MFKTAFGDYESFKGWSVVFSCTNVVLARDNTLYADLTMVVIGNFQ